jgi:hypothetical protein
LLIIECQDIIEKLKRFEEWLNDRRAFSCGNNFKGLKD